MIPIRLIGISENWEKWNKYNIIFHKIHLGILQVYVHTRIQKILVYNKELLENVKCN